mgnify:CR=1 FL=1
MAQSLEDDIVEVRQIAHHVMSWHIHTIRDCGIKFLLELFKRSRIANEIIQQRTRGVGCGITTSNQLCESLSGKFLAAKRSALLVAAFLKASKEIFAVDIGRVLNSTLDSGDSNTCEVLDCVEAVTEEWIREVAGVGLQSWVAAKSCTDFTSSVQNLNGRGVDGRAIGGVSNFGKINTSGKHTERSTEGKVANNVKGQIVEPGEAVEASFFVAGRIAESTLLNELVELFDEEVKIGVDIRLKLSNGFGRESV